MINSPENKIYTGDIVAGPCSLKKTVHCAPAFFSCFRSLKKQKYSGRRYIEQFLLAEQVRIETAVKGTEAQVKAQVDLPILTACASNPLSSAEIAAALGHKQLSGNLRKALPRLREEGLLEYMIPEKPKSRLQKYRLTEKGRRFVI